MLPGAQLPLLEAQHITAQNESAAALVAASLSALWSQPLGNISAAAGELEREAPLFFGAGDNPSLFTPPAPRADLVRIIRRCQRKACGHTWTLDYTRADGGSDYRETAAGRVHASNDWRCPVCSSARVTGNTVRGQVSDHACDARCMGAVGPNCECSCGGRNHGAHWL
jgi:hypothetical protein